MLTVTDEYSRECLAIVTERSLKSDDVLDCLTKMFIRYEAPEYIRSDNGSESTAKVVRRWLSHIGVQTLYTCTVRIELCYKIKPATLADFNK